MTLTYLLFFAFIFLAYIGFKVMKVIIRISLTAMIITIVFFAAISAFIHSIP